MYVHNSGNYVALKWLEHIFMWRLFSLKHLCVIKIYDSWETASSQLIRIDLMLAFSFDRWRKSLWLDASFYRKINQFFIRKWEYVKRCDFFSWYGLSYVDLNHQSNFNLYIIMFFFSGEKLFLLIDSYSKRTSFTRNSTEKEQNQ